MTRTRCVRISNWITVTMAKTANGQNQLMELNLGPQHPATHGVLRIVLTLDGERVVKAVPHLGYLHRGVEKIVEDLEYFQITPILDRLDYIANLNNELSYVMAIEKMADIKVPERAEYIRVIMLEFNRIMSHLGWFGPFTNDVGLFGTAFLYSLREREFIQRLFERVTGARMHYHYFTYGGVRNEVHDTFKEEAYAIIDRLPSVIDEFEYMIEENEIFRLRTKGIGVMDPKVALNYAAIGPFLRASGVPIDLRKDEPYSIYDRFDFNICVEQEGDCFARYKVHMNEIRESMKIIRQALDNMPDGPVTAKVPRHISLPEGETYMRTEHARGEFGVYLVSDGSPKPYRMKLRSPSLSNLMASCVLLPGMVLPDLIATVASVDIVLGCTDR
jgi:NADH-quinone oxidoreductase subunit D